MTPPHRSHFASRLLAMVAVSLHVVIHPTLSARQVEALGPQQA